jgi:D-threonate/D-erythronate kinase
LKRAPPKLVIVADDLTGAMDAAAPFAARGVATRLFVSTPAEDFADPAQVVSFTTDSRHASAEEAQARTAHFVSHLRGERRTLFKKIDSTLRGHVAVETRAALAASGCRHAIVTPAFPAQGRILADGEVWVNGVRLRDSAIGGDALSPPPRERLGDVFRAAVSDLRVHDVSSARAFAFSPDEGEHAYIVDASQDADLLALAEIALARGRDVLCVGSSGFAHALAEAAFPRTETRAPENISGPLICVVGSRTPESARQAQYLIDRGARLIELKTQAGTLVVPSAKSVLVANTDCPSLVLRVTQADATPADAASAVRALAAFAAELLSTRRFAGVIATGGDTARALLERLGVAAIDLVGELLPGIALGTIEVGGAPLPIVTKAGGFGDDGLFVTIRDKLAGTG